jgi:hypothetical protein
MQLALWTAAVAVGQGGLFLAAVLPGSSLAFTVAPTVVVRPATGAVVQRRRTENDEGCRVLLRTSAAVAAAAAEGQGTFSRLVSPRVPAASASGSSLRVAADVEYDIDMPPMGNNGVYNVMDERQYK